MLSIEKWIGVIQVIGSVGWCEGKGFRHREKYMQRPEPMRVQEGRAGTHKQNLMKVAAGSMEPARGGEAPRDEGQVSQEARTVRERQRPSESRGWRTGRAHRLGSWGQELRPPTRGRSQCLRLPSLCPPTI